MKTINLGKTGLKIPAVALGCMRITELDRSEVPGYIYHTSVVISYCPTESHNLTFS